MNQTVFAQIMELIQRHEFNKCVRRYRGNYRTRHFSCWDQFLSMSFAQFSYRESLRDIEACLNAQPNKIKAFLGTSANAVKTQVWIAISVYVLVAIIKKRLNIDLTHYTILQIFSVSLFEKVPIYQLLTGTENLTQKECSPNQLKLWNF